MHLPPRWAAVLLFGVLALAGCAADVPPPTPVAEAGSPASRIPQGRFSGTGRIAPDASCPSWSTPFSTVIDVGPSTWEVTLNVRWPVVRTNGASDTESQPLGGNARRLFYRTGTGFAGSIVFTDTSRAGIPIAGASRNCRVLLDYRVP